MTAVTTEQLRRLAPKAKPELINAIVENWPAAETAGINTPRRIRHFFARVMVETGGLTAIEESLNYSVDGLLKTFSRSRISLGQAKAMGRSEKHKADQSTIATTVYGGAWGEKNLGNTEIGDGWRYRGSGMLQTTGRTNFAKQGYEDNPEVLRQPVPAFLSAVKEWARRGCNAAADKNDTAAVCKAVNGGSNGLAEQRVVLARALKIWTD